MKTWRDRLMERPLDRLKQDIRMQRAQLEIVKKDLATAVLLAMEAMILLCKSNGSLGRYDAHDMLEASKMIDTALAALKAE